MTNTGGSLKKYTDITPEEIEAYLTKFKEAIKANNYTIALNSNRRENINFIEDYKIDSKRQMEILLDINYKEFCYAVDNENEDFAHEILYIFCKTKELDYWGKLEVVDIYIKINMTQTWRGDEFVYIVSFHKRNKPIEYLFI